jgi:riboflavin transporter FmnP
MNIDRPTVKLAGAIILAPLTIILQALPPIFVTPWMLRIDLVAVPWIICWIIFGLKPALLSLVISAPLVGFVGPFAGGAIGATMKPLASIWMFLIPAIFAWKLGGTKQLLENKRVFVLAGVLALIVRAAVTVLANFYFALPLFYNMTPDAIIGMFSSPDNISFFGNALGVIGLGAYIAEVAFWNTIQGIIDLTASLILGLIIFSRVPELIPEPKTKQKLQVTDGLHFSKRL